MGLPEQILLTQPSHLKGYWKCNETSGNLADSSGNAKTLTATVAPSYSQQGPRGPSVGLNGTNQYCSRADVPIGAAPTLFTFSMLIKGNSGQDATYALSMANVTSNAHWIAFRTEHPAFSQPVGSGVLSVNVNGSPVIGDTSSDYVPSVFDGKWHLVIARYNGTQFDVFKDSASASLTKVSGLGVGLSGLNQTAIGAYAAGTFAFCGCNLEHIALWDSSLTGTEISNLVGSYFKSRNKITLGLGLGF